MKRIFLTLIFLPAIASAGEPWILAKERGKTNSSKPLQYAKAFAPICVTVSGIPTRVSPSQPLKIPDSTTVSPKGRSISIRKEQFSKAFAPIV